MKSEERAQAKALKAWCDETSLNVVAKEVGCSSECIARFVADMGIRQSTRKLIRIALAERAAAPDPV